MDPAKVSPDSDELSAPDPLPDATLALAMLDKLPTPLCLRDRRSRYVWANAAFHTALGRGHEELVGKTDFDLLPRERALLEQTRDERVFQEGHELFFEEPHTSTPPPLGASGWHIPVKRSNQSVEYVLRQWSTALHPALALATPNAEESVRMLKEQQSELLKKERLLVLGQLAGSLAHSIRNPLAAISNAVAFLRRKFAGHPNPDVAQALRIAQEEVWTANRIIADLLAYSRIRPGAPRNVSVQEMVETALSRESVPEGIRIECRVGPERVQVDPAQVWVAIANLIRNACEAMNEQGTLTIASRRDEDSVEVTIADTGVGISQEEIALLFEPLVTSKALGIGLGLTTARALVTNQGGTLECEGERGKGARFKLRLPPALSRAESGEAPESQPDAGFGSALGFDSELQESEPMLIDQLKQKMFQAMKAGNTIEKEILRTAIGEVTRAGEEASDERVTQVLRKLVKSNQETLGAVEDAERREELEREIAVLETYLPRTLDSAQIQALLAPVAEPIRAAAGAGPAMGIAMKFLKAQSVATEARDVQAAVAALRQTG